MVKLGSRGMFDRQSGERGKRMSDRSQVLSRPLTTKIRQVEDDFLDRAVKGERHAISARTVA